MGSRSACCRWIRPFGRIWAWACRGRLTPTSDNRSFKLALTKSPEGCVMSSQKVAVITGAGTGVGKAVALALLRERYAVVLAGRRTDKLAETAAEAKAIGGTTMAVHTHAGDQAAVHAP